MRDNEIAELPAGIFDGMVNLKALRETTLAKPVGRFMYFAW